MGIKNILKIVWLILVPFIFFIPDNVVAQTGTDGVDQACPCGSDGAGTLCWACPVTSTPPPSGGGGGGGGGCTAGYNACPPNTNCTPYASGYHCNTYNINYNSQSLSGWTERACTLGNAQAWCNCCEKPNSEGICMIDKVVTYSCCPIGTTSQWYYTYPTPTRYYTTADTCQGQSPYGNCASGDTALEYNPISVCGRVFEEESNRWVDKYVYSTTCQTSSAPIQHNVCVTQCTATSPSTPTLLSPSNGASITNSSVSLVWNNSSQTWGNSCTTNNNQFEVYIGTSPSSLGLIGTVGSSTGSVAFSGNEGSTYYWKVRAKNGSANTDSAVWSFTITSAEPWWQVKDGDVTTNADIVSEVPTAQLFDVVGLGGFAGVPVYGSSFNLSASTTKISATAWHVNTQTTQSRIFNYAFFDNLIPDDVNFNDVSDLVSGGTPYSDGYEWYTASGNVTTSGDINIGNRKVILFIENGNFNINGKINLNDGMGFFGVFVDGDITVANSVAGSPSLEGIYLSNESFSTGAGTSQLHVRGSVATFGTVNLQRDLANDITAAELFEFAPDQMLLFPEKLMFRRTKWTEVAP